MEEGEAGEEEEAAEAADDPDRRVELPGELELAGPLGGRRRIDARERDEERVAELLVAKTGSISSS